MSKFDPPDVMGEPGNEVVILLIFGAIIVGIALGIYYK